MGRVAVAAPRPESGVSVRHPEKDHLVIRYWSKADLTVGGPALVTGFEFTQLGVCRLKHRLRPMWVLPGASGLRGSCPQP